MKVILLEHERVDASGAKATLLQSTFEMDVEAVSTEAAYFPSMLGQDHPPFLVSACDLWQTRQVPFGFIEVHAGLHFLIAVPGRSPVGHDEVFESQLLTQKLGDDEFIFASPKAVQRIIGCHHGK